MILRSTAIFLILSGLLPAELPRVDAIRYAMEKAVAQKQAAGVVTLAMKDGTVIHHDAVGFANLSKQQPMQKNALFWIASMTKSVSTTAIMTLVDEGKLSLDEPASKWLPELGKVKMADGSAPKRPITLRDLMSHTAGIAFPPRKATDGAISLKAYTVELLKAPLAFEPGSAYEYGFGITIAGRIAEIVSGKSFEKFVEERITAPLGMKDTTFHPNEAQRSRIAMTYTMNEETKALTPAYNPFVTGDASVKRMVEPSGGLFSTASDMSKFYQMIANKGLWDGRRIVSEGSLKELTSAHKAGDKPISYGLGWMVNIESQRPAPMMPVGGFGHGGAYATHGGVDTKNGLIMVYLVQNVLVPNSSQPRDTFHRLIYESLGIEPPKLPAKVRK